MSAREADPPHAGVRRRTAPGATLLAAGLLASAQLSCAFANPAAAPAATRAIAVSPNSFASNAQLVDEVARRLTAMLPPQGTLAVLVQLGQGEAAARAKADLVARLAAEKRIVWSQVSSQPGGPLPDSTRPGQHVNTVQRRIEPPPQLVMLVNVSQDKLYMAARPPGADPLGPPDAGWTWVLNGP